MQLLDATGTLEFGDAELVVIPASLPAGVDAPIYARATELLRRQMMASVENGAILCVLTGPDFFSGGVGWELAASLHLEIAPGGQDRCLVQHFTRYLRLYAVEGRPSFTMDETRGSGMTRIAVDDDDSNSLAAFALRLGSGLLYFIAIGTLLPVVPRYVDKRLGGNDVAVGVAVGALAVGAGECRGGEARRPRQ